MADAMPQLQAELSQIAGKAHLSAAVDDVDKIIAMLTAARQEVASG